jgi:diadenosine tetraphosphate (Ap4A) HIT family hydrolase
MNATIRRFGYPATLLREYGHWVLLLRPEQVTLGSLVLAAKGEHTALADLPEAAFTELRSVFGEVEQLLKSAVRAEKINYLMLMMVDPHVHYHVFPRYAGERSAQGLALADQGWPGMPAMKESMPLSEQQVAQLVAWLREQLQL